MFLLQKDVFDELCPLEEAGVQQHTERLNLSF
jgi:hypothetical protein